MNPTFRKLILVALALVLAAAWVWAGDKDGAHKAPPLPVVVEIAVPLPAAAGQRYTATLIPREQVTVSFKVAGYVSEIMAGPSGTQILDRGDPVSKGEVLARLRDAEYKAKVNTARFSLEEAKAAKTQASAQLEREARLSTGGYLAKSEFDKSKERADATAARVENAASQLEEAKIQLADTALTAPLSGIVAARSVERGVLVAPGTKAFVVADFSSMKAVFGVPDALVGALKAGRSLDVVIEAVARTVEGKITAVSPSADPKNRVYEVEVTIPNTDRALKDGMAAVVALGGEPQHALPSVPLAAVVRPRGKSEGYAVHVVESRDGKDRAFARVVRLGRVTGSRVEVLEGLATGDRVVTVGATLAKDGDPVRIIPDATEHKP